MRDGLADGLARVRERLSTLRGRGESTPRDRYVLLPTGSGRRRRLAEIGAAVGAVVVVLAFVGATVALRPTSSSSPQPDTPGLPAPTEVVQSPTGSSATPSSSATAVATDRPTGAAPPRTTAPRTTAPPSATVSPSPSPTPTPTPTTEPPAPGVAIHPFG